MKEGCKVSRKAHKTNFVGNTFKIGNVLFFKTNFEYCAEPSANTVFCFSRKYTTAIFSAPSYFSFNFL